MITSRPLFSLLFSFFWLLFSSQALAAEEDFLLIDAETSEVVLQLGSHIDQRITPCSTFKVALSLMGYDAKILKDEQLPHYEFQGECRAGVSRPCPQTPRSWMKNSCVWYSRRLVEQLELEKLQTYLDLLEYGNEDMSGGLTEAWLSSSLKISPREQVAFLQKMIHKEFSISIHATDMTRELLYIEELPRGWKLFGKTGLGHLEDLSGKDCSRENRLREALPRGELNVGWFIGWIEKDATAYPFAYTIREEQVDVSQRIPRAKELLMQSSIFNHPYLKKEAVDASLDL